MVKSEFLFLNEKTMKIFTIELFNVFLMVCVYFDTKVDQIIMYRNRNRESKPVEILGLCQKNFG